MPLLPLERAYSRPTCARRAQPGWLLSVPGGLARARGCAKHGPARARGGEDGWDLRARLHDVHLPCHPAALDILRHTAHGLLHCRCRLGDLLRAARHMSLPACGKGALSEWGSGDETSGAVHLFHEALGERRVCDEAVLAVRDRRDRVLDHRHGVEQPRAREVG